VSKKVIKAKRVREARTEGVKENGEIEIRKAFAHMYLFFKNQSAD
jgi:hypothetical protein